MKGIMKGTAFLFALAVITLGMNKNIYAGTGIYVGKDASAEKTAIIGVSLESEVGVSNINEIIEKGSMRKGDVIESSNGYRYTLPDDNAKMIVGRSMAFVGDNGWNNCASNEYGVSVVSYITTDPNVDAVIADPFVEDGICEEKIASILAATSKTARQAVQTLCTIYEETGADAAEIVLIADPDGAWVVENFTGHQYVATKLPDDCMAAFGNEPIIKTADPDDKDTICSSELFTLPEENGFAVYDKDKNLDLILTYNADNKYSEEAHLRGWVAHDIFAPSEELDFDDEKGYDVFFKPDEKVGLPAVFDFFRNRYEGTAYDLAEDDNSPLFGINNQYVSGVNLFQIFDDVEKPVSTVLWSAPANPTAAPFMAIPTFSTTIPEELATDLTEDGFDGDVLQLGFAALNNAVFPRRNIYGASIRQYWEGVETVSVKQIAELVRGEWKDEYDSSPEDAADAIDEYIEEVTVATEDDCERLKEELEWYMFKNGIMKASIPDEELVPFECSFDAVAYAEANGWETEIDDEWFIATKGDQVIAVGIAGEAEGCVTLAGFDNDRLLEEFMADEANNCDFTYEVTEEVEEETEEETKEETEEPAKEADEPQKEAKESKEETEEPEAENDKSAEEAKAEGSEPEKAEESSDDSESVTEEVAAAATQKIEVDTIDALSAYFAEKTASIPRDGWAENEIAKQLGDISNDVVGIYAKYFGGADIEDLIGFDAEKLAGDEDVAKVTEKVAEAGTDLSALAERYITALYEDLESDVVNGRITREGAVKILNEAEGDLEGITRLYIEGITGAFADVFNPDLTGEEFAEILAELGDGTLDILEDYGVIDLESLGLGDIRLKDLTDADIEVVITLNEMDDDVIQGLSDLLGVDVRKILDEYMEQINGAANTTGVVEEKHEAETANSAPDPEVMAAIEKVEIAEPDDDYVVPQEIIDILNEAIAEAQGEAGEAADETATEEDTAAETSEYDDLVKDTAVFTLDIGKVAQDDGRILLPAYLLKCFN